MPYKPLSPCRHPGCAELTAERYCPEHKSFHIKTDRPSSNDRGYNSRWRKARVLFLRDNPLCEECKKQGRYTPATVVDHIRPHKGNKDLFWDCDNWQALCKQCHDRKTATEDGGFGHGNIIY